MKMFKNPAFALNFRLLLFCILLIYFLWDHMNWVSVNLNTSTIQSMNNPLQLVEQQLYWVWFVYIDKIYLVSYSLTKFSIELLKIRWLGNMLSGILIVQRILLVLYIFLTVCSIDIIKFLSHLFWINVELVRFKLNSFSS